jgi:predicted membrane protein
MSRWLDSSWARFISLTAAITMMLLVTLLPRALTTADGSAISHGVLMLIMWGMSAGFVHGIGFIPRNAVVRVLLGPVVAWLGMGVALIFYVQYFLR